MARQWWSVSVTCVGEEGTVDVDALDLFHEQLLELSASVTGPPQEGKPSYGARVSVEAADHSAAVQLAADAILAAAKAAGLPAWPVARLEAMTEQELDLELARTNFPELVGVSEIAHLLARDGQDVSRQRASAVTKRADFPSPVAALAAGPVWTKPSVRNFVENWERKPGRPRTTDVGTAVATALKDHRFHGGGEIVDSPKERGMAIKRSADSQFVTKRTAKANPKVQARKGR